jgi:uncharacterized protein
MKDNIQLNRWITGRLPSLTERLIVLLTGARQTGKTTTARTTYKDIRYFNLDSQEIRLQFSEISSVNWGRNVGPAVLDEIQKLPGILEKIKYAYDDKQIDLTVLSGS